MNREIPSGIIRATEEEIFECDVIIICVAISSMEHFLERIKDKVKPGTVVMDTCSVKVYPVSLMKDILPDSVELLGTHPMFGPDSGKYGVEGLPIVISEVRNKPETYAFWLKLFNDMKLSVVEMTPEQHDKEAAYTQGITHFTGRTLADMHLKQSLISTSGYRSLLNIIRQTCNDDYQLFLDLQKYNPYTAQMRNDLKKSLNRILKEIDDVVDTQENN